MEIKKLVDDMKTYNYITKNSNIVVIVSGKDEEDVEVEIKKVFGVIGVEEILETIKKDMLI